MVKKHNTLSHLTILLYGIGNYFTVFSAPVICKQHGFWAQPSHTVRIGSSNRVNLVVA